MESQCSNNWYWGKPGLLIYFKQHCHNCSLLISMNHSCMQSNCLLHIAFGGKWHIKLSVVLNAGLGAVEDVTLLYFCGQTILTTNPSVKSPRPVNIYIYKLGIVSGTFSTCHICSARYTSLWM